MAESIKGLSVKIGADTSDFIKELKKVDKEINQGRHSLGFCGIYHLFYDGLMPNMDGIKTA